jgi:phosphoglycolate phosphatase-like HAD superfamily hydrolase
VLDLDAVVLDTTRSHREAAARTVNDYFEELLGLEPGAASGPFVDVQDVATLRHAGGFGSDMDVACGLVRYGLSLLDVALDENKFLDVEGFDTFDAIAERAPVKDTIADLLARKDVPRLASALKERGGGLRVLGRMLGARNRWLAFYEGDVTMGNVIARLYQEHYLGDVLFADMYRQRRRFADGPGLIDAEEPLIERDALACLQRACALALVTSRTMGEAEYALDRLGVAPWFSALVTVEELRDAEAASGDFGPRRASLSRPHPFMLVEAIRKVVGREGLPPSCRVGYVGAMSDDMAAAVAAREFFKVTAIGAIVPDGATEAELRAAGAEYVVPTMGALVPLVAGE